MKNVLSILIMSAFLTACGSRNSSQPPLADPLLITANNAVSAAKASWEAANNSAGLSELVRMSDFVAATPGGHAKPGMAIPGSTSIANMMQKIPFGPITVPCAVSGFTTTSGDIANPETLTAGDTLNVDADNCDDGLGEIVDGQLALTVSNFFGDIFTGAYDLGMSISLSNFQITTAEKEIASNGVTFVSLNTTQITDYTLPTLYSWASGSSLTTDTNTASMTLTDYSMSQEIVIDGEAEPTIHILNASGTLDSTDLDGPVDYRTTASFLGLGSDYPHTGELLTTGASSSARLIAVDNINVRIEIDLDGDGGVDETINSTWVELEG